MDFIRQLKGCEAHYGREKSRRIYMTSDLNITKLWRLYNEAHIDQVFIFILTIFMIFYFSRSLILIYILFLGIAIFIQKNLQLQL